MEQPSRENPAPTRSGDAPNFCLIKLDLPGPEPGSFPSLVPRAEADLRSRRPAPPGRFFVSVRITNIFCSKGMLRPATVSYVRFPMHQEDIKICTARDQRRLPYVWRPGTEGHQVDDTSSCDIRYGYNALVHCHRADYVAKPDLSCPLDRL